MFHKQIDYAEFNEQVSFFISNGPEFMQAKYFSADVSLCGGAFSLATLSLLQIL